MVELRHGSRSIRIHGNDLRVGVRVVSIDGMSGHADRNELSRWFRSGPSLPRLAFITHGEPVSASALADLIKSQTGVKVIVPAMGDTFDLRAMLGA